jgi:hypothetical protein
MTTIPFEGKSVYIRKSTVEKIERLVARQPPECWHGLNCNRRWGPIDLPERAKKQLLTLKAHRGACHLLRELPPVLSMCTNRMVWLFRMHISLLFGVDIRGPELRSLCNVPGGQRPPKEDQLRKGTPVGRTTSECERKLCGVSIARKSA